MDRNRLAARARIPVTSLSPAWARAGRNRAVQATLTIRAEDGQHVQAYADFRNALWSADKGGKAVASRQSVPVAGIAGLQRAARLAGESFGHEDVIGAPLAPSDPYASRWLWWLAAIAASAGFAVLHFS
jgi:hypothetical protein